MHGLGRTESPEGSWNLDWALRVAVRNPGSGTYLRKGSRTKASITESDAAPLRERIAWGAWEFAGGQVRTR